MSGRRQVIVQSARVMTRVAAAVVSFLMLAASAAAGSLEIVFVDVEGGQATLIRTPAGESLLIDAGYGAARGSRDAERIVRAARDLGVERIDFLLVTHFHSDHVGGVPELAARMPIGTFIDYGAPRGTPYGADRLTTRNFALYEPVRSGARHLEPNAGDRLPLQGIDAEVVSIGGMLVERPLAGAGEITPGCTGAEEQQEDGTENFRSIGVAIRFGLFSFVALGDLSGNTLTKLICPRNLVGQASVYLIAHHGDYDSNVPALYAALRPRIAVMNNGPTKGGDPATFRTLHGLEGLDLWQLHASKHLGARNAEDDFIANVDDGLSDYWIKVTANDDGEFSVVNSRTGFSKSYSRETDTESH